MAVLIVALCLVPVAGLYSRPPASTAITEQGVYAEVLATRVLETTASRPWRELEQMEGNTNHEILKELFKADKRDDWYITLKEYRRKLGVGRDDFRGTLTVRRLAEGLMVIEVVIHWTPPARGSDPGQFALFRLRGREDFGLRSTAELTL